VNQTRFPKEDHLPDSVSRDNQVKKGDCVEGTCAHMHVWYLPGTG